MEFQRTRELFEPLIQRPPLTDHLLQRPPFKFIHDVVNETVRATGCLADLFTADDLDPKKVGADKASKISFLEKLIDGLNIDGSLDDVKPAKIVAGKDPEYTNLMLQKLAMEAALVAAQRDTTNTKKERSKSKDRSKSKTKSSDKEKEKEKSADKEKKKSKSSSDSKPKKSKSSASTEDAKSKKPKKSEKEKKVSRSKSKDKGPFIAPNAEITSIPTDDQRFAVERESSGGTSKGGDDSGIAEETGAESERHDIEIHQFNESLGVNGHAQSNASVSMEPESTLRLPPVAETETLPRRPVTSAARPQTSMGRPGTAAARPAPPKIKKTKVADLDTTTVSQQANTVEKTMVLMEETENAVPESTSNDFIVEEEEEPVSNVVVGGADISELTQGDEYGQLVNRIIENTRKLENDAGAFLEPNAFYDLSEQKKLRNEVETVQRGLQTTAQNTQPIARSLGFITEDFDLMLKEIEDNRKSAAQYELLIREKVIADGSDLASMSSKLRSLNDEIKDIKNQISRTMAKIIDNEKKMRTALSV